MLGECVAIGGCLPGEARLTGGHNLPAAHVIHTVGPIWRGGDHGEAEILARCYRACLAIAAEQGFRTVAFPAIATGVFGFPKAEAAAIAITEVCAHLAAAACPERVILVCFDESTRAAYREALATDLPAG